VDFLYGHDAEVAKFVGDGLDREILPPYVSIGVLDDLLVLRGGMVFNDYTGPNIEITIYGPGQITRQSLKVAFGYVFEELKCIRLTARTRRDNRLMCKLLPRLGFDYEATMKQYFGPDRADDALVFRLTHAYASKWM
jgi:hypothetical protein